MPASGSPPDLSLTSIIVVNHNYGRFLAEAIESALGQTHPRTEVIVVDDGSDDNSREVMRRYRDRVSCVLKENGGAPSAINAGFAVAKGEIVMILDADDVLKPHIAEEVAAAFAADPTLARVQYRFQLVDRDRSELTDEALRPACDWVSGDFREALLNGQLFWWPPMSSHAFAAAVLRKILPMPTDEALRFAQDAYLCNLALLLGRVRTLKTVGNEYRVHGANRFMNARPTQGLNLESIRRRHRQGEILFAQAERLANSESGHRHARIEDRNAGQLRAQLTLARLDVMTGSPRPQILDLCRKGVIASFECRRLRVAGKLLSSAWFVLMSVSPRRVAFRLAAAYYRAVGLDRPLGRAFLGLTVARQDLGKPAR